MAGDWRDVQKPDGDLPYTAPTYFGGGGPAWSGICVTLPWQVYLHYGDRRILETCYPTMQRWIAFLGTKAKDHQLRPWGGIGISWAIGCRQAGDKTPARAFDDRSTLMFNNCYYLDNVAPLPRSPGCWAAGRGRRLSKEAEAIADATHRAFFDPKTNRYANGRNSTKPCRCCWRDARGATAGRHGAIGGRNLAKKKGHVDTGIHGTYYLIKSLLGQNRNDLIFAMVNQKTYPGWGYMLEQGATTLWEQWDGENSLLHSLFVSVGSWFIEGVAGIQLDPAQPGYKHFFIRPGIVGDLTSAKRSSIRSMARSLAIGRSRKTSLTLTVEVPVNTRRRCLCRPMILHR